MCAPGRYIGIVYAVRLFGSIVGCELLDFGAGVRMSGIGGIGAGGLFGDAVPGAPVPGAPVLGVPLFGVVLPGVALPGDSNVFSPPD